MNKEIKAIKTFPKYQVLVISLELYNKIITVIRSYIVTVVHRYMTEYLTISYNVTGVLSGIKYNVHYFSV